jgi:hypothetical protein
MLEKLSELFKNSILSENKGTDALEYVGMAAIVIAAVSPAAKQVANLITSKAAEIAF